MTQQPLAFADRVMTAAADLSTFCFGCDPSPALLESWSLPVTPEGLSRFVSIVLDAAEGSVAIIKPQVAFFEAFGPAGLNQLARLIAEGRARGLIVLADVKRTDIGTSTEAYGRAWLGEGSGFGADAMTASAYMGAGSLAPLYDRAARTGTGVFVVVRSSNPEGDALQSADMDGVPVADRLAQAIRAENARLAPGGIGPVGAVIGATLGETASRTVAELPGTLFLVPGLGQQGGSWDDLARIFGDARDRVIPTSSRAVLGQGPDVAALKAALAQNVEAALRLRAG